MNNRRVSYRRSVYRRRRIRTVLIVAAAVLVALLLLFLWIGNLFSDKLAAPEPQVPSTTDEQTLPTLPAASVRRVQAPALPLFEGERAAHDALTAYADDGQAALSLALTDDGGLLSYRSEVADRLSMSIRSTRSLSLATLCETAESYGIYLCGSFTLRASAEEDALVRSVYLSEAAAVVAEAFSYGIGDVVLRAPETTDEMLSELILLAESVKRLAPNAVVGIALPDFTVAAPDESRLEELAYAVDYLALDLSRYGSDDPAAVAEAQTDALLYYLLRYEMRVLIPAKAEEAVKETVTAFHLNSWMTLE